VTLGAFTMRGPVDGPLQTCTLGLPCALRLTGHSFAASNRVIVTSFSDTCGQALTLPPIVGLVSPAQVTAASPWHDYSLGTPTSGLPGDYTVCWSHHGGSHDQYDVRATTLRMGGPVPADRACTLSEPCNISLDGVRLAHTSKLLLISRASACGEVSPGVAAWAGFLNPAGTMLITPPDAPGFKYADGDTYDLGLPYANPPGTAYQICWAFDPTAAGGLSDYKVPVGSFVMNGPEQGMRSTCTMGQPCNLQLSGLGLAATNRLQIVAGAGLCGTAGVTPAVLLGIDNPRLVTDDAYDNQYSMGMVVIGGAYSACRVATPAASCIGSHYRLCWAHGVHIAADGGPNFAVEVGKFVMSGPFVTYTVECTLGLICAFRLYGSEFKPTNRILVIEEHGACGVDDPPVAHFEGISNPAVVGELSADGTEATFRLGRSNSGRVGAYRVCWAYDPLVWRHYNIEVGPFIFAGVPSECSIRDPFGLECA